MTNGLDNARERVAACAQTRSEQLDLSGLGIKELPDELWKLNWLKQLYIAKNSIGEGGARAIANGLPALTVLNVANNQIGAPGAEIIATRLTGLTTLDISGNYIGESGAKAIASRLTRLTALDISGNRIGDIGAKAIANGLKELTVLYISNNRISDTGAEAIAKRSGLNALKIENNKIRNTGAQAIASGLTNLVTLKIENNRIRDEGAQAIAKKLTKLATLKIGNNRIGYDGAKAIFEAFDTRSDHVHTLTLRRNPVSFMPKEVLGGSNAKALLAAYRRYKQADQSGELVPLNDAKILIVGDAEVGKTSLVNFLVHDKPRTKSQTRAQPRTKGIDRTPWTPEGTEIAVNVWDFAGQEITFGTHQYFLTERSLYILVLSDQKRHDRSIYRWLPLIKARADDAPVIVVINQCDNGEQHLMLQWDEIRRIHPQAIALVRTSCEDDDWARESINQLRTLIVEKIETLAMQDIRFPSSWVRIKNRLTGATRKKFVLKYSEFIDECERPAHFKEPQGPIINDQYEQHQLLRALHNLGVVMVPGISQSNLENTQKLQLLDPNWLAQGIDSILNSQKLLERDGIFNKLDLRDWLDSDKYPKQHHEKILDLMLDESIELAVQLKEPNLYLVPQALPAKNIDSGHSFSDHGLNFAYMYDPLPNNLLPHFIVRSFQYSKDATQRSRYGVLLDIEGCPVHVAVNIGRNILTIRVGGDKDKRPDVLVTVRKILSQVNHILGLDPKAHVPLTDDPDTLVSYEHLRRLNAINDMYKTTYFFGRKTAESITMSRIFCVEL
ncbi:MAG: COR domain-containing protein [Pseudomonadota bacterium]